MTVDSVKDLKKIIEVFEKYECLDPPRQRTYAGNWREVIIPVGEDCSLYITMHESDYNEIYKLIEEDS